jgi:multidrug efflux pump subunit AcrB
MFFLTGVARYLVPWPKQWCLPAGYGAMNTDPDPGHVVHRNIDVQGGHLADAATASLWLRPFVALGSRFEQGFARFREGYRKLLGMLLARQSAFVILFLVFCAGTGLLVPQLGQDFFPQGCGPFPTHVRAHSGRASKKPPACGPGRSYDP